ncbi:DUF2834 domain-containing protein [Maribacter sp. 2307ULW6-5]|uniref:DUF2834 domain-containing protein n=1 Tax=Maribacter sp. 2307ULW6-5 TaxID=3386275 RepID=UPI0039BCCCE1
MSPKTRTTEMVYLFLAIIGLAGTWYFNAQFYLTGGDTSITHFIAEVVTTIPAKSIAADISVVAMAFLFFMVRESRRIKLRHWWIFIPLTFFVALAFSVPLFLYFRERQLRRHPL